MRFLWLNFDNHSGLPLQQGGLGAKVTEGTQVQISRVAASDVTYVHMVKATERFFCGRNLKGTEEVV